MAFGIMGPLKAMDNELLLTESSERADNREFYSVILPGQNGGGGESYKNNLIVNSNYRKYEYPEEYFQIDLGQGNCVKHFADQLQKDQNLNNKNIVGCGISQGTATWVHLLAGSEVSEEFKGNVKMLVLESVLGTGNSAITHTVLRGLPSMTYVPFSRFWLPVGAKLFFPTYNPLGMQAISSAKKLPKDLPIIIMHDKNDFQLWINDARKFYCAVKESGNDSVYLLETSHSLKGVHLNILNSEPRRERERKIRAIQAIYKKHGVPYDIASLKRKEDADNEEADFNESELLTLIAEFQPAVEKVKKDIEETSKIYRTHNIIDGSAVVGLLAAFIYAYSTNIGSALGLD